MKIINKISCKDFPCTNINKKSYLIPDITLDPKKIKILMIAGASPDRKEDFFHSNGDSLYIKNTLNAFDDAKVNVKSIKEITDMGIYLTTAVKCGRIGYSIPATTIENCSHILEKEISYFPNIKCFLLLGDVAIKSFNYITKRQTGKRVIPSGSTYKIRVNKFYFGNKRVFPSYLQTGKNYLIEKSKRKMIAEDIRNAVNLT